MRFSGKFLVRHHSLLVLVSLLLIIGAMPVLAEFDAGMTTSMLVVVGGVVSGVLASARGGRLRWIAVLLACCPVGMLLFHGLITLLPDPVPFHAFFASMSLFLAFTIIVMTWEFMRSSRADFETIAAALSVYLLIGFLFACLFAPVLKVAGPLALTGLDVNAAGALSFPDLMYYSLVTLTTLGYGDMSPVNPVLRSLATLEAILGQTFLVVLVARLVGLEIAGRQDARSGHGE